MGLQGGGKRLFNEVNQRDEKKKASPMAEGEPEARDGLWRGTEGKESLLEHQASFRKEQGLPEVRGRQKNDGAAAAKTARKFKEAKTRGTKF